MYVSRAAGYDVMPFEVQIVVRPPGCKWMSMPFELCSVEAAQLEHADTRTRAHIPLRLEVEVKPGVRGA